MLRYRVIWSTGVHEMEAQVNGALRDGWALQGGVSTTEVNGFRLMAQAVVIEDPQAEGNLDKIQSDSVRQPDVVPA